ncbi:MarR family winged helix-turn-helix transcriptional regulator [Algoriphagus namhaensis]|uniref:HTH-type transcriptional regulator SarZ n=1 Tax=Algoriphagus namhaensis TaxID=915353 RepID=A0ABV8AT36_9BACT
MLITHDISLGLYSSSRLLIQLIQSKLLEYSLTYPQYLVMSELWESDGLRVNQIGEKLNLDSGTLTPLLKKLESQNYIKRVRGEADERTVTAELTYPGKSLQSRVEESLKEMENSLAERFTENTAELNQTIQALLEQLQTIKKESTWKN